MNRFPKPRMRLITMMLLVSLSANGVLLHSLLRRQISPRTLERTEAFEGTTDSKTDFAVGAMDPKPSASTDQSTEELRRRVESSDSYPLPWKLLNSVHAPKALVIDYGRSPPRFTLDSEFRIMFALTENEAHLLAAAASKLYASQLPLERAHAVVTKESDSERIIVIEGYSSEYDPLEAKFRQEISALTANDHVMQLAADAILDDKWFLNSGEENVTVTVRINETGTTELLRVDSRSGQLGTNIDHRWNPLVRRYSHLLFSE